MRCWRPASPSSPTTSAPPSTARHRPGRHPGPAVQPRPVQAHRAVGQRPRRRLVRPRGRPPRTRGRQGQAAAENRLGAGGHHRRHRPAARRAARHARTSPSAWPWPGPAKTPAAPAPACWPPSPPAGTRPAGSATTAPTPPRSRTASTCPPGRWATSPVMDYRADQLGIQANSQRRHAGRGHLVLPRPARAADHRHRPPARSRHRPRDSTTSRSPPAPPTSSNAKTARTPTATSGCPAPPSATTPG